MAVVVNSPPTNAGYERDTGSILGWGRSHREGHGNQLQYSCLENPMDRGVWWATVHGVAKSCTWLKQLSNNSSIPLELIEWYMKERKYPRNTTESRIINVSPFGLTLLTLILITSQKNAQELCSGLLPCYTEESGSSDCFSNPLWTWRYFLDSGYSIRKISLPLPRDCIYKNFHGFIFQTFRYINDKHFIFTFW